MLDKFTHTNSKNEVLDFTSLGIIANKNDLRDFEWSISQANNKITGFYKGVVKKTIPFVFLVDANKATDIKNLFYEHFEYDVISRQMGHFTINGYKYYCYAVKSVKTDYLIDKRYLKLSLQIASDDSFWYKETTKTIDFSKQSEGEDGLRYPFTYPFTYKNANTSRVLSEGIVENDAIIRVYGSAENPLVKINDNVYQVDVSLASDEYMEIDTEEKTIFKYNNVGNKTNLFDLRDKRNEAFAKVPTGTLTVSANGSFKVDIVIIEKRGEPRWV